MNKFYLTTAIPYPNGKPHLGFAFEVIIADVIKRYHQLIGDDVYLLAGTDEHGLKVFQSAQKEGLTFQQYVDKNSKEFTDLKKVVNFSYDDFIRTTDQKKHWPGAIKLWEECVKAGKIYKKTYTGLYCVGCEEFKQEKDLVEGLCPEHKKAPDKVEEENYFFKLTDFTEEIKQKIESGEIQIIPESRKNEILGLLKQGAEDFSVSRPSSRIPWGVPVPNDNTQTMYVWFDALANYITAIGYGQENETQFEKLWPADLHVIGKGISRFHAIFWPALLLAANIPLFKTLLIHGYVNIEGEKISKSLGNVISPKDILEKYGESARDPLRYFLLRYITINEDGNFSYEEFEKAYNSDLANGLGNLIARVAALSQKNAITAPETNFKLFPEVEESIKSYRLHEAVTAIWSKISEADKKINEEKPWELEGEKAKTVLIDLVKRIQQIAYNLKPFLPETAEKILNQYSNEINTTSPLFPRIQADD